MQDNDPKPRSRRPSSSVVRGSMTVMDAGRILNPLAGRNQIQGRGVMGIGMALFEETTYDPQNGAPINSIWPTT